MSLTNSDKRQVKLEPPVTEESPRAKTTELYMVRHGEPIGNNKGIFLGQHDALLSEEGQRQAQLLADHLCNDKISVIYSSDLKRAHQTASIIAATLKLPLITDAILREVSIGSWSGLTSEEIATRYPNEWSTWIKKRDPTIRRGGGECYVELQLRIVTGIENIASRHEGNRILVVSHGRAIWSYLAYLLKIPLEDMWHLNIDHASITRILLFSRASCDTGYSGRLISYNDTHYLNIKTMHDFNPVDISQ